MKALRIAGLIVLAVAGWIAGYGYGRWYGPGAASHDHSAKKQPTGYHCPMHPSFRSDKPGDCGICGMKLVPDQQHEPEPAVKKGKILHYRDPHDHSYTAAVPGLNPATGNDLEPVYEGDSSTMPHSAMKVSYEKQQLIGVRWGAVSYTSEGRQVRVPGRVVIDERKTAKIQTRIDGWIEQVFADFTGRPIKKGEPLLTIYSPELLASQQEYLLALRSRDVLRKSSTSGSADALISAARRRLLLFDLSESQIEQVERTGEALKTVTLYAPMDGYVMTRNAFPKQRVTPETELYTIADLSNIWVMAEVFESDAAMIRAGMAAVIRPSYGTGPSIRAKVEFIQPDLDPMTRTLKIRLEADNPGLSLKPEMWVETEFESAARRMLSVPAEAVLDSGERQTVFVDLGSGFIDARQVKTGARANGRVEILSGLKDGDRIAVSGNFLLDSESQLRSAAKGSSSGAHQHD